MICSSILVIIIVESLNLLNMQTEVNKKDTPFLVSFLLFMGIVGALMLLAWFLM